MASTMNPDPYDPTYLPQRTSVMAIIALVLGLVCIPGMGLLALIFGIAAIVAISGSRGRLTGTGMAVCGVILGLLFSVIWTSLGVGAYQGLKSINSKFVVPTNTAMSTFDSTGDPKIIRDLLPAEVNAKITDAQIASFRSSYQAELGSFKRIPTGMTEAFQAYSQFGKQMQKYQAQPGQQPDLIPVPAMFDKGWALVILRMDRNRTQVAPGVTVTTSKPGANGNLLPLVDVGIETLTGKVFRLSEMSDSPASAEAKPADAKPTEAPKDAPKEPAKPADTGKG